jgi:hypothetical protein
VGNKATNSNQEFLKLRLLLQVVFVVVGLTIFLRPRAVRFESNQGAAVSKPPTEKGALESAPS